MSCIHYWDSPYQVASHHLARQFAASGWKVAYISSPITPFHLLKGFQDNLIERFAIFRKANLLDLSNALWAYTPFSLMAPDHRPFLRNRLVIDHWHRTTFPQLMKVIRQNEFEKVDILYLDNFYHSFWHKTLNFKTSIYHMADNYSGFPGYSNAFKAVEKTLVQAADCVFFPSKQMEDHVRSMHPADYKFVSNGVDVNHFSSMRHELPNEYKTISSPIVIYVGAMDKWFDFELMIKTATTLKQISFVLIGEKTLAQKHFQGIPNIHLFGNRNWKDLPAYLQHADAGIIPFNVKAYPELINPVRPLKLFEYFASGLPVVSVKWDELCSLKSPAVLCDTDDKFIEALASILTCKHDKNEFLRFASTHDWGIIFDDFMVSFKS